MEGGGAEPVGGGVCFRHTKNVDEHSPDDEDEGDDELWFNPGQGVHVLLFLADGRTEREGWRWRNVPTIFY